ncbi:flagellar basal body rod protein FlgB [Lacticigenium naphthae]|uniref:flagellar basal body rod protein FlgB n=1 Tax=Lacticigenium naphthae TaxID=515351 RepID=UPI00042200A6|nr:flagellar basal body rod protein FlgB [Lacticigenium naphthae]
MDHTYQLLQKGLQTASLRQEAISSNLSNVNTANYKVNKVEFESLLTNALNGDGMSVTHQGHIGYKDALGIEPEVSKRTGTTVKEDGNNVDVDLEMTEMAANSIYYQALIQQVNAKYSMMRSVMK